MTAQECAKEYIRIVEDRVEPDLRTSKWDEESKWVEETITRLVQSTIEEDRKSRECCKAEREALMQMADEMEGPILKRDMFPFLPIKYLDKVLIPVVDLIAAIRARFDS
jgi:hypothetical protein